MTSLWNAGSDIDAAAEAVKKVPQFSFDARPLPDPYSLISRSLPAIEDSWKEAKVHCSVCFCISRDLALFQGAKARQQQEQYDVYTSWHVVLHNLARAAESGCLFCNFMMTRLFNDPGYSFVWTNGYGGSNPIMCCFKGQISETKSGKVDNALKRLNDFCAREDIGEDAFIQLIVKPIDCYGPARKFCKVRFQAATSNLNAGQLKDLIGLRREITLEFYKMNPEAGEALQYFPPWKDLAGKMSMDYIPNWIDTCLKEHDNCPKPEKGLLPTRTIEILDNDQVQISSVRPQEEHYVCLSYCWGGPQKFTSTLANEASLTTPFSTTDLPVVIRNAIDVTRSLGLKHLWVDALCILQDSVEDKDRELAMMASYYKNAYITICSRTTSCEVEFLHQLKDCEKHPGGLIPIRFLPFRLVNLKGATGVSAFCEEEPYSWSSEPISRRAWTFQERVLSPRALMFGSRLLWQCHSVQKCAGGVEDFSTDVRNPLNLRLRTALRECANSTEDQSPTQLEQLYNIWYQAVKEYSYRSLSLESDKLPAVSALAAEFAHGLQDEYIAGIWRKELLRGLLWSTYPSIQPKPVSTWRAPSWSWVSTESVITYERLPPDTAEQIAQVLQCSVELKNPQLPFAEISDATLEIRGPVMPGEKKTTMMMLQRDNHIPRQQDNLTWRLDVNDMQARGAGLVPGAPTWEVPDDHILLVLFARVVPDSNVGQERRDVPEAKEVAVLSGLVLTPAPDAGGKYQRVGRFMDLKIQGYEHFRNGLHSKLISLV